MREKERPRGTCGDCCHWALLFDGGGVEVGVCEPAMLRELGVECSTKAALDWLYWHTSMAGLPPCDEYEEA